MKPVDEDNYLEPDDFNLVFKKIYDDANIELKRTNGSQLF